MLTCSNQSVCTGHDPPPAVELITSHWISRVTCDWRLEPRTINARISDWKWRPANVSKWRLSLPCMSSIPLNKKEMYPLPLDTYTTKIDVRIASSINSMTYWLYNFVCKHAQKPCVDVRCNTHLETNHYIICYIYRSDLYHWKHMTFKKMFNDIKKLHIEVWNLRS